MATNLRYLGGAADRRSIAITSAGPAEGKTTVISNLAVTLARMGRPTALIDGDLRRGRLHEYFGVDRNAGLSSVAAGFTPVEDGWHVVHLEPDDKELAVMPSGPPPPDPVQLLENVAVEHVLSEARQEFEYVLIDTPPVLVVSDAIAISQRVDGVLIVVRLSKTTRDQLKRLATALEQVGVKPIGAVVTGVKRESGYYSDAYSYYGVPKGEQPEAVLESSRPS